MVTRHDHIGQPSTGTIDLALIRGRDPIKACRKLELRPTPCKPNTNMSAVKPRLPRGRGLGVTTEFLVLKVAYKRSLV